MQNKEALIKHQQLLRVRKLSSPSGPWTHILPLIVVHLERHAADLTTIIFAVQQHGQVGWHLSAQWLRFPSNFQPLK